MKLVLYIAKAVPSHLVPKLVFKRTGGKQTYWVDPRKTVEARKKRGVTQENIRDAAKIKKWSNHSVADHMTPHDYESARLMIELERHGGDSFKAADWKDPVGESRRDVREVTDPETLADIQKRLDDSASHGGRKVKLLQAFDMRFEHKGFDKKSAEIGNVQSLYHGVNAKRAAAVIATGLKTPHAVGSVTGQMFGPGIYFADSSTKSAQYIGDSFGKGKGGGIMLECDVALGNVYEATRPVDELPEPGVAYHNVPSADEITEAEYVEAFNDLDWDDPAEVIWFVENYTVDAGQGHTTDLMYTDLDGGDSHERIIAKVEEMAGENKGQEATVLKLLAEFLGNGGGNYFNYDVGVTKQRNSWAQFEFGYVDLDGDFSRFLEEKIEAGEVEGVGDDTSGDDAVDFLNIADDIVRGYGVDLRQEVEKVITDLFTEKWADYKDDWRKTYEPIEVESQEEYHSIEGLTQERGGTLQHPEFIVYDSDQVKIRRVLRVQVET